MLQGQGHPRKMDKSTILQRTIDFLQKQKGEGEKSHSIKPDGKINVVWWTFMVVPNTCQMSSPNLPSFTLIAFISVLILFILDISTNDKKTEL